MTGPVAVTAMAGIFPGAGSVEEYWAMIREARPGPLVSLAPRWGFDRARYFDPKVGAADRTYADTAFCLDEGAADPRAAGGDRHVALGRRVLETLLRSASGLTLSDTALVLGTSWTGEGYFESDARAFAGLLGAAVAGDPRAAYSPDAQLAAIARPQGLGGPEIAVDAACASSLYAVDVGLGLLETGQARAVAVLGLNAFLPPFALVGFSKLMALSPRGSIRPFAADASGIVCGECVAGIVIEALEDALRAGRAPLAVIRGLGLSSDGADRSVFAPGPAGQLLAYERAYASAALDPGAIDYVEAHGTATAVGDETELASIEAFFLARRDPGATLPLGSVKALIGHTLAAAGLASIVKALLMLRERTIPPHIPAPPHARVAGGRMVLPREASPIRDRGRAACIGISSFGFGGSNAHLVLEEMRERREPQPPKMPATPNASERARASVLSAPSVLPSGPRAGRGLAIIDLEAALGPAIGAEAVRSALEGGGPASGEFPWERFLGAHAAARPRELPSRRAHGLFFPTRFTMDAAGLRAGPNLLRRIDGVQLLFLRLVQALLARNARAAGSKDTAAVVVANLGGEMALRLSRKYALLFRGERAGGVFPETTVEAIASSLSSMCSGYAAAHFDLRAFHATLAGAAGTFLRGLLLAPHWLATRCRTLLLGACRAVRSPIELDAADRPPICEAAGLFLLKDAARAEADGDRILSILRAALPGAEGSTLEETCRAVGIDSRVVAREVVDVGGHERAGNGGVPAVDLGEAAGVEALVRALARKDPLVALELRSGARPLVTLVLERRAPWLAEVPKPPRIPIEIGLGCALAPGSRPPPCTRVRSRTRARANASA